MIFVLIKGKKLKKYLFYAVLAVLIWAVKWGPLSEPAVDVFNMVTGNNKLVPIYRVDTGGKKRIAISFDAAWGANYTEEILKILKKYNIKTTFFLTGIWVEKYPDMVKKIDAAGHEIGNHSTTHAHFNSLNREQIKEELMKNHKMINILTGQNPRLFRPPFGEYSNKVIEVAREMGYTTIQWDVDSLDWHNKGVEPIVNRVLGQVKPGSIVLFHNNAIYTTRALIPILDKLKEDGYKIVPVSKLLLKGSTFVNHEGEQKIIK